MRKLMLSLAILLILFILLPFAVQAEGVSLTPAVFPDNVLRAYLAENGDLDGNHVLDDDEIKKLDILALYDCGITSLEGTEFLTSLTIINCGKNPLTEVPTRKWPQLQALYCNELSLKTLDLSCLPELMNISCDDNSLISLDLSCNPKLQVLSCANNLLKNLDVSSFPYMTDLTCDGNALTSLDLSRNTALQWLSCSNNPLTELDLSNCPDLWSVICSNTNISSLDLSGKSKLSQLYAENNQLTDLNLSGCAELNTLICRQQFLTELDLSDCPKLTLIQVEENRLPSLHLKNCLLLETLHCQGNQLAELDVSGCPELKELHCGANSLKEVDVSKNPKLKELWVESMTGLTTIDLRNNPELMNLCCYWNDISSLDFSCNPKLEELWIDGNHLTHADLSCTKATSETVKVYNNIYYLDAAKSTLDLSTFPGFDVSRASQWKGGTVSGTILTLKDREVSYVYDCGRGISETFVIKKAGTENGFTYEPLDDQTARITACSLTGDIEIPETLGVYQITDLAKNLFSYKHGITSVTLPATLTRLGGETDGAYSVFVSCYDLQAIYVNEDNTVFSSANGSLFSKDGAVLEMYPAGRNELEVIFPVSVTRFAFESFYEIPTSKRIFIENPDASWDLNFTILKDAIIYYHPGGLTEQKALEMINSEGYTPGTYHPTFISVEGGDPGETADAIADRLIQELIADHMSPMEKALALHDWITSHAHYSLKYDSPTGILKYGEGHCESYAKAYHLLLNKAGVENRLVGGTAGDSAQTAEGHLWNQVKIGNVWLHVDCTWDDPVNADGSYPSEVVSGMERHDYFLVPTQEIKRDHFWDGSEEDQTGWVAAEGGTAFLNEKGKRVTGWQIIRGDTFYFDENGVSVTGSLTLEGIPCDFETVCVLTDEEGEHYAGVLIILKIPETFDGILTMPIGMKQIGEEAFAGTAAEAIYLPDTLETIGSKAFADLQKETYIFVDAALKSIAADACEGSQVIFVVSGTAPDCLKQFLTDHQGAFKVIYQ